MAQVKKEKLRQDILKVSSKMFYVQGYANTSIKEIADKLNISVGNIYNYFENKEDIFNSIVNDDLLNKIRELIKTRTDILFKKELDEEITDEENDWLITTFHSNLVKNYKLFIMLKKNIDNLSGLKGKLYSMINELVKYKIDLFNNRFNKNVNESLSWMVYSIFISNLELYTRILENEKTSSTEKMNKLTLLDSYHISGMKAIIKKLTE